MIKAVRLRARRGVLRRSKVAQAQWTHSPGPSGPRRSSFILHQHPQLNSRCGGCFSPSPFTTPLISLITCATATSGLINLMDRFQGLECRGRCSGRKDDRQTFFNLRRAFHPLPSDSDQFSIRRIKRSEGFCIMLIEGFGCPSNNFFNRFLIFAANRNLRMAALPTCTVSVSKDSEAAG